MLFKRRSETGWFEKAKLAVWPRRNHARSTRYVFKRVLRIRATPHAIAAGVAAGVFASFTPLMGLHFFIAFGLAFLFRGSFIAAALGTAIGNPLTFPAIWASTLALGSTILGYASGASAHGFVHLFQSHGLLAVWEPFIKPMLIGALPIGGAAAIGIYISSRFAVAAFQKRRAEKRRVANDNGRASGKTAKKADKADTVLAAKAKARA
ncbi:MAG: DUF2062 domain-containing protein [Ahrensia sp.]